jgi:hypothetical protein
MESTGCWRRGRLQRIWCEEKKLMKEREASLRNKLKFAERRKVGARNLQEDC